MASTLAEAMVESGLVTEAQLAAGREDQQNVGGRQERGQAGGGGRLPYGLAPAAAKALEAAEAAKAGASEIALVTHPTALRTRDYPALTAEIAAAVAAAAPAKVRAVLEVGPLGREEKVIACALVRSAGAESVATGTGAGLGGATASFEDVALLRAFVGSDVPVHAAAARTAEEAGRLLDAGASRVGVVAGTAAAMMTRRARA